MLFEPIIRLLGICPEETSALRLVHKIVNLPTHSSAVRQMQNFYLRGRKGNMPKVTSRECGALCYWQNTVSPGERHPIALLCPFLLKRSITGSLPEKADWERGDPGIMPVLLHLLCRHRTHPDVHCDRVSQGRPEELGLQFRSHADEAWVPQQDRRQIQEEDRGDGQVRGDNCSYRLITSIFFRTQLLMCGLSKNTDWGEQLGLYSATRSRKPLLRRPE